MRDITSFSAANRGTSVCEHCGVLSWASRQDSTANRAMCVGCFDAAGWENGHQDGTHEPGTILDCPTCHPEREARRLAAAAKRVAGYQATHLARQEKIEAQKAKAAAKAASVKHCAASRSIYRQGVIVGTEPCDGRGSKTSDYCATCRPYHPHGLVKQSKADRDYSTKVGLSTETCGICGYAADHDLHQGAA